MVVSISAASFGRLTKMIGLGTSPAGWLVPAGVDSARCAMMELERFLNTLMKDIDR